MVKASLYNIIGVEVDSSYPWIDSLFISKGIASLDPKDYANCKAFIKIKKSRSLYYDDCRSVGSGLYISSSALIDKKFGVRIERESSNIISIITTQQCNEWLSTCVQLFLLELNYTFIHAAALEKDGKVILIPSWGGVGKTATVITMIKKDGWRLLGDDLVILKKDEVMPYLKPFVIYPYHKSLFPDIFESNKGRIITNLKVSNLISQAIPIAKRIMRPVPGLLALARKYNPQSLKISPMNIFNKEQLSSGGKLIKVVWLERTTKKQINYYEQSAKKLTSKTVAVTLLELFAERMNNVFVLCGSGIFDYEKIYKKMYDLIFSAYKSCDCYELDIPLSIPVNDIGNIVSQYVGRREI